MSSNGLGFDLHPEVERLTLDKLRAELATTEESFGRAKELGNEELETYLIQRRRLILAELRRRTGENLTSDYRNPPSEVKFEREVSLATLQTKARERGGLVLNFLPFLSQERFIVKGWSHLLAGYPKAGKTELLVRVIAEWPDQIVLYVTEEPRSVWDARMQQLPQAYSHVVLFLGLGARPAEILARIQSGNETVVVLDTVRNLLGLKDEKDNSEVARALIPYIAAAREMDKTLIALHHDRKGGGEHGEGIAGGHAFLGVVDIALELKRDGKDESRRRLLRGWGRVIEIPKLMYELREDSTMVALGSPAQVALEEVKERLLPVLEDEWVKTKDVRDRLGDPKPSEDQVLKGLETLAREGNAERDPPLSEGRRQGARYRWRRAQNLTSDERSYRSEVKLETEIGKEEGRWTSEL